MTEELIRLVDRLEERAQSFVTLDDLATAGARDVEQAIAEQILLVDYRTRVDGTQVTLCRLNRRHPLVARLTGW